MLLPGLAGLEHAKGKQGNGDGRTYNIASHRRQMKTAVHMRRHDEIADAHERQERCRKGAQPVRLSFFYEICTCSP